MDVGEWHSEFCSKLRMADTFVQNVKTRNHYDLNRRLFLGGNFNEVY